MTIVMCWEATEPEHMTRAVFCPICKKKGLWKEGCGLYKCRYCGLQKELLPGLFYTSDQRWQYCKITG